jgi:hypothetical protein
MASGGGRYRELGRGGGTENTTDRAIREEGERLTRRFRGSTSAGADKKGGAAYDPGDLGVVDEKKRRM